MFFRSSKLREQILKNALKEIKKLLVELETQGKDLKKVRLRNFKRTHSKVCTCEKCKEAERRNEPGDRGLREMGFKVFFYEEDKEE